MISRLKPADVRPTIPEKDVKWLGRASGFDYIELHGVEYAVTINPVDPQAYSRQSGELMIVKRVREVFEGTGIERTDSYRATLVVSGTFAGLAAKEAERKARAVRKASPRPLDALATHPLLRRSPANVLRVREESEFSIAGVEGATRGIVMPGREPVRGPQAIVEVLRGKGIDLRLSTDKGSIVPVAAEGRTLDSVRELIERAAPLLVPFLAGSPRKCQLAHKGAAPEAASLLVGGAAACEAHLAGELAPY